MKHILLEFRFFFEIAKMKHYIIKTVYISINSGHKLALIKSNMIIFANLNNKHISLKINIKKCFFNYEVYI